MSEGRILVPDVWEKEVVLTRRKAQEKAKKMGWRVLLPVRREEFSSDGEYYEFLMVQEEIRRELALKALKTLTKWTLKLLWSITKISLKLAYIFILAIFSRRAAKFALVRLFVRMV